MKTFAEEFDEACKRLGGDAARTELERVHMGAKKDPQHAFRDVSIRKPDPWKDVPVTGMEL